MDLGEISASWSSPTLGLIGQQWHLSVWCSRHHGLQKMSAREVLPCQPSLPTRALSVAWTHTMDTQSKVQNPHELLLTHRLPLPIIPTTKTLQALGIPRYPKQVTVTLKELLPGAGQLEPTPVVSRLLFWEITNTKSSNPSKFEFVVLTFNSLFR